MTNELSLSLVTAHFAKVEGMVNHLYLDGEGVPTIGIGCTVNSTETLALTFYNKETNLLATLREIIDEFTLLNSLEPCKLTSYYAKATKLYIKDETIFALFNARIKTFILQINDQVTELCNYPVNVQLAVLDMAFNLGVRGLMTGFPKFLHAVLAKDYKTAAAESHRVGVSNYRNDLIANLLLNEVN